MDRSNLITRRRTLATIAGLGAGYFIPAWNETVEAADILTCVSSTPTVTEGPDWVDEKSVPLRYPHGPSDRNRAGRSPAGADHLNTESVLR